MMMVGFAVGEASAAAAGVVGRGWRALSIGWDRVVGSAKVNNRVVRCTLQFIFRFLILSVTMSP